MKLYNLNISAVNNNTIKLEFFKNIGVAVKNDLALIEFNEVKEFM